MEASFDSIYGYSHKCVVQTPPPLPPQKKNSQQKHNLKT